jgi:2-keto-4-pentenoate hydratase
LQNTSGVHGGDARERAAAEWIAEHRLARQPGDLPAGLRPASEDAAYRIQFLVCELLGVGGHGHRAGWKVGITTPQMRALIGIETPVGGTLLAGDRHAPGATLASAGYCRLGIECEIAMVLAAPLGGAGETVDAVAAAAAVATIHPAVELVDDRYHGDYLGAGAAAIVADNAFQAGFVLGPAVENWRSIDLGAVRGTTRADGTIRLEGRGADVFGHPMNSLAWIATRLGALGLRLEPGEIVLTGSLPVTYWASAGELIETEIERLGSIRLSVA